MTKGKTDDLSLKMEKIRITYYQSPVGEMKLGSYGDGICLCDWVANRRREAIDRRICSHLNSAFQDGSSDATDEAKRQLDEYFAGKRRDLDMPLFMTGTEFQCRVWRELMKIPYGVTLSYGGLALRIQNPNAVRAVASAIATNPISLFVPCHRVIGSNNNLTGYAGGLDAKRKLLDLEGSKAGRLSPPPF